jgi:dolichol-phosphate mannosyltransferase
VLFVDDGSTDDTVQFLTGHGELIIQHDHNEGVGAAIRDAIRFARSGGYETIVIMAGNGKMLPSEIHRLLGPIRQGSADYVQGSRYLEGGTSPNLPVFRKVAIRLFTLFAALLSGFRGTDVTCGFRAYRLAIMDNPEIDLAQEWLGRYELEYYLHYKVIRLGYRVVEVPVSMVYPEAKADYSKIKPIVGWWSMIRPWIYLSLGLRK